MKKMMVPGAVLGALFQAVFLFAADDPWAGEWIDVTPQNGVWDDCYKRTDDPSNCSIRFRVSRYPTVIGVEAYVRDDRVVVDDCPPGLISCTTWTDDCLEVFFDGDGDRNPNTRGPDYEDNPLPCNAGGEYAIAANGSSQSDYASAKKCFGEKWGGVAEPWMENGRRVGTHYRLWFAYACLNRPTPRVDEKVRFGFTICVHDDDDGGEAEFALYWKGNPKIPYADESAFGAFEFPGRPDTGVDPLVPFDFKAGDPAKQIAAMRTLREKFGLKRFIFTAPGHWRLFGRYDTEAHALIGRQMAEAKAALKDTDIEIGWWDDPTIRGGFHEPGQHIMDCDGAVCDALCPLDAKANAVYCDYLKTAAKIGRPSIYFFEDDFTLSNHSGLNAMKGCFCPLHLAEYARRVGKAYTAKEIAAMFRNPTAENEPLRRAFADLSRDSLAQLGRQIRAAIDEVDPTARVCLCQSGFVDVDGDSTEAIARALAGNTRPMVRIYGAGYCNQNRPCDLPTELAHTYWSAQHLPKDIELLHESDPYPHSRFFNSSRFLMSEIAAACMAGVDDSFLYCTMYSDDPLCDTGYAKAFDDNRRRLAAVREFRRKSQLVGVRAVYDPEEVYLVRETEKGSASGMLTEGAFFLAKLGFPMTTCRGSASVLFGSTAKYLSEEKLKEVLAGAVLVDAEAAIELQNRGLGRYLGCTVTTDDRLKFYQERTLGVPGVRKTGTDPYHSRIPGPPIIGWSSKAKSIYARLKPSAGAEVQAVFEDMDGRVVTPSFVSAKNELGGTVGVIGFSVNGRRSSALYSPLKQELFRNFLVRASRETLDVCAPHTPATWLAAAVSDDGLEMLVMVNNLAGEPRDDIALDFSAKWRGGRIERLTKKGGWTGVGTVSATTRLGFACEPMVPEFVRVTSARKPMTRRQRIYADYMEGYGKAIRTPPVRPDFGELPFKLGVASWTFHTVGVDRGLEIMKAVDCHVLCHRAEFLPYTATDAEIAAYKAKLAAFGVETLATGPLYADNEKEIREQFEFAKRFGLKVVVGVPFDLNPKLRGVEGDEERLAILPPEEWNVESDRVLDIVDRLVREYDIRYAIHNHGPDNAALFATAEAALKRIGNRDRRIGVCLDVGHELRAGVDPVDFIRRHGDRIYDVHLKNVQVNALYNIPMPGPRGELDIPAVLQALTDIGYSGACHIEYEKDYQDNTAGLAESVGYYRGCMDSIARAETKRKQQERTGRK